MKPEALTNYALSEKQIMDEANGLLRKAQLIFERKLELNDPITAIPLPYSDSLKKALEMAKEGYDTTKSYHPGAEGSITIVDELEQKIKELEKPPEPEMVAPPEIEELKAEEEPEELPPEKPKKTKRGRK